MPFGMCCYGGRVLLPCAPAAALACPVAACAGAGAVAGVPAGAVWPCAAAGAVWPGVLRRVLWLVLWLVLCGPVHAVLLRFRFGADQGPDARQK